MRQQRGPVLGGSNPDFLAQIGVGNGIGFALELDVVIGMDRRLLPEGYLEALCWQGLQGHSFTLAEDLVGLLTSRAVLAASIVVDGPVLHQLGKLTQSCVGMQNNLCA